MSEASFSEVSLPSANPKVLPAPRAQPLGRRRPFAFAAWGWIVPLVAVAGLELLVRSGMVPSRLLPAPSEIGVTLLDLAQGDLFIHIAVSSARVVAGFVLGTALAIAAGIVVGLNRRAEAVLDPTLQGLRAVPSLAWVPLLLLWLGIDEAPKVTLIAIGAFFPVYLNLFSGIRNVDRKLIELGEIFGLDQRELVRRILIPAALPSLFTGLRLGLSLSWMFLVAAELIAATKGLGYLLTDGRETSRPDLVLSAIFLLGLLGKLSDGVLKAVERRALAWRDSLDTYLG